MKKGFSGLGIFNLFAAFVGTVSVMDYVFKNYILSDVDGIVPLVWAFTVAIALLAFFGLLNYCLYAQSVMQDEIDRMGAARKSLELALLTTNRKSSNTKNRRRK